MNGKEPIFTVHELSLIYDAVFLRQLGLQIQRTSEPTDKEKKRDDEYAEILAMIKTLMIEQIR